MASLEVQHLAKTFQSVFMGAAGGGVASPSDDEFNRVSFLSHFDGSSSGVNNVFDDGSSSNHTITASGNVTQGSFGPFARPDGYWGVNFSNDFLTINGAGDFTGDYTLEAWVFVNAADGNYVEITYENAFGGKINVVKINNGTDQNWLFGNNNTPSEVTQTFNTTTFSSNTWTHIAVVRSSNVVSVYINGVADSNTPSLSGGVADFEVIGGGRGLSVGSANLFEGNISNVRFSSVARYTSNFTPSTSPFSSDANTDLLTCQSNRFVDNSNNARTVAPTGNPAISAFGPFLTSEVYDPAVNGASAYFDGNDDRLSAPDSADFDFGTGDFTVELFFNYKGNIANRWLIGGANNWQLRLKTASSPSRLGEVSFWNGFSEIIYVSPSDLADSAWHHIAITREGTNLRHFLDGALVKTTTDDNQTNLDSGSALYIGASSTNSEDWDGYISNVRVVKGTAVYTSAFTPPTAPLTAVTNTKLLLNMADGQAIDSTAQNNLTLFGDAKISNAQAKFGDTSIYFDGTGDYATLSNSSDNNFGSGDWTIEGWLYLTANAGTGNDEFAVASKWGDGSTRSWLARIANGNKLTFWYINGSGTQVELTPDTRVLSLNTWYHVAWVKNSNLKVYIDGVGATLAASDFEIRSGTDLIQLSGRASGDNMYQGYIDDFRISHTARYTANFTAPTAAFADKGQ